MTQDTVYIIDAHDTLVEVNETWDNFAIINDGTQAVATEIVGQSLWNYIAGKDTQKIYREVLALVRE